MAFARNWCGDEGTSSGGESGETEDAHWEIQVVTGTGDTVSLADLPKYDPQSGKEWVYVVQETPVPGYEQVFGTVTWDPATYSWVKTLDDLQEEWGEVREGNSYLYNGDTLTNLKNRHRFRFRDEGMAGFDLPVHV